VDLRGATFLDCAGVGALARLQTIVEQRGGDFRLFE
jgi:anti-anti-sigma regulatory factor